MAVSVKIGRTKDHESVAYSSPKIYINDDFYREHFKKDYSDMMPYDLEHELWAAYYGVKKGYNPEALDLKEGIQDPRFSKVHRLAIRRALRKAHEDGRLDDYLNWVRVKLKAFEVEGDTRIAEEWVYYQKEAAKIRRLSKKQV